jgi:glutamate dehydrogenase/leucine dehydrogenase
MSMVDLHSCISGAGNVATYAAEKAIGLGAKVLTLSASSGLVHDPDGLTKKKIDWIREQKAKKDGHLEGYPDEFGGERRLVRSRGRSSAVSRCPVPPRTNLMRTTRSS